MTSWKTMERALAMGALLGAPLLSAHGQRLRLVREISYGANRVTLVDPTELSIDRRGRLYVHDRGREGILVLDSAGDSLYVLGRRGHGPGEADRVSVWGWTGDTLWIADEGLSRITFFPGGKMPARTRPLRELAGGIDSVPRFPYAFSVDGTIVWMDPDGTSPRGPSPMNRYIRLTRTGKTVQVVATFPWMPGLGAFDHPGLMMPIPGGGVRVVAHPFPPFSLIRASSDGAFLTRIDRQPARGAGRTSYTLTRFDAHGGVAWRKSYSYVPHPARAPYLDSIADARNARKGVVDQEAKAAFVRAVADITFLPPVQEVVIGRDGTIFLQREGDEGTTRWELLDGDGKPAGALTLPPSATILAGDRRRLWVREVDNGGDVTIGRYALRPTR